MEDPISDNNVSTTNDMSDGYTDPSPMMAPVWDLKEEEEEVEGVAELMMGIPVGVNGDEGGMGGMGMNDNPRGRFRSRLGAKGISEPMPPLSQNYGMLRFIDIIDISCMKLIERMCIIFNNFTFVLIRSKTWIWY